MFVLTQSNLIAASGVFKHVYLKCFVYILMVIENIKIRQCRMGKRR